MPAAIQPPRRDAAKEEQRRRRVSDATILIVVAGTTSCLAAAKNTVALVGPGPNVFGSNFGLYCSKALSLGVIAGSLVGKLPQVRMIWATGSAQGISKISMWTETASMGIQFAYNVMRQTPLTTYAEVPILFAQLLVLVLVAAWADGYLGLRVWLAAASLCAGTALMALGILPAVITATLYAANTLLVLAIIIPQVLMNYREKSTGKLSMVVTAMTCGGSSTRLFTTLIEVDDPGVQVTMILNWLLTATLMCQFWMYRDSRPLPALPVSQRRTHVSPQVSPPSASPLPPTTRMKKHRSMVQLAASFGSSRCLSDLAGGGQVVEVRVQRMVAASFHSFQQVSRFDFEFSSFRQTRLVTEPSPDSAPDLDGVEYGSSGHRERCISEPAAALHCSFGSFGNVVQEIRIEEGGPPTGLRRN